MSIDQRAPLPPMPPIPPLDPSLPVPIAMIVAGLAAYDGMNPVDLPADTALLVAQVLLNAHDRTKAHALAAVADVDRRELFRLEESTSTATWLVDQATSFGRDAVGLARKLDRLPQVAARIAEGGLSLDDGMWIGRALDKLRPHVDRPDGRIDGQPAEQALAGVIVHGVCGAVGRSRGGLADADPRLAALHAELVEVYLEPRPEIVRLERAFLVLARIVAPGQLRRALDELVDALLPGKLDRDAIEDEKNRFLDLTKDSDRPGWSIRGHLDDETGELLSTALNAAAATDPDNPLDTEAAADLREQGLDPYADGCVLLRTRGQRRHDALRLLVQKALAGNVLGLRGKAPVHVNITVSNDALHGAPGSTPATGSAGQTLPISLVRRLVCEGSAFTRFVMSLGGKVIETSHTSRTLKPHERRVKRLETGGVCQAAGCSRGDPTGHPLIPHHVDPFATTGTTRITDTVMFCAISHTDLHHGKTVRLKDGRSINEAGWVD